MDTLLIALSVVSFACNATVTRAFQIRYPKQRCLLRIYQLLFSLVAAVSFFSVYALSAAAPRLTASALISGILFGVFYYGAVVFSAIGYETGSMALTSIIMNMSLFIPLVYSCLVLGDALNPVRVVGIALIAITMLLAVDKGNNDKRSSVKWLLISLCGFAANGVTAVIQKRFVLTNGDTYTMLFMAIAYATAAILFGIDAAVQRKTENRPLLHALPLLSGAALLSGLGSFGGNALLGYLCNKVNGAILYPCVNGGLCILCALVSFAWFKEKPSRRKLAAIAVGITAIVLLCI